MGSMKAVRVSTPGGADALQLTDLEVPRPKRGEVLVRLEVSGVNFIDVYHRSGLYKVDLPFTPGQEGAGRVEEVGEGVEGFRKGDRVAYARSLGSYAELAAVPASVLVPIPDGLEARDAAAAMLQGMTAHYLAVSTYPIRKGDRVLIHAAAGGVGGLLVQVAKMRGARVLATVSSDEKERIAREAGADEVFRYDSIPADLELNAVYDGVGRSTFEKSVESLGRRGMLVLFGQSSGPVPPFDVLRLQKKALFLTRPSLHNYTHDAKETRWRAGEVFEWIRSGTLRLRIDRELPLAQAAEAHRLLESRKTIGKLLLRP
jgi:NADPH2:quinone reductase